MSTQDTKRPGRNDTNVVVVTGKLTRDPELSHTPKGTAYCKFGIAVNESYNDKEKVHFLDVTVWGKPAEGVPGQFRRGSPILISGKLNYESWEKDGKKNSKLTIAAITVGVPVFGDSPRPAAPAKPATAAQPAPEPEEDDVPF